MAVDAATRLAIYNDALVTILGSRRLASLNEDREPRRVLDVIWDGDTGSAAVEVCLGRHGWNFAIRTIRLSPDSGFATSFGPTNVFNMPEDFVRMESVASDEMFSGILTAQAYRIEAGFIYSELPEFYMRYVSIDPSYGLNSGLWPQDFKQYLAGFLAYEGCEPITNDLAKQDRARMRMIDALKAAQAQDGMAEGTKFPPHGSWVTARGGGRAGRRDGGYRGSLIQR